MKTDQLHEIIKGKNDERERHALRTAEAIIENIVTQQQLIAKAQAEIVALREELKQLEVQTLDAAAILG